MICLLKNSCIDKDLCCNFCSNKKCQQRCKDDCTNCKWLDKYSEYKVPEGTNIIQEQEIKQILCKIPDKQKRKYTKRKLI